jgi:hypothetical protein
VRICYQNFLPTKTGPLTTVCLRGSDEPSGPFLLSKTYDSSIINHHGSSSLFHALNINWSLTPTHNFTPALLLNNESSTLKMAETSIRHNKLSKSVKGIIKIHSAQRSTFYFVIGIRVIIHRQNQNLSNKFCLPCNRPASFVMLTKIPEINIHISIKALTEHHILDI